MSAISELVEQIETIGGMPTHILMNPARYLRVTDNYRAYRLRLSSHPRAYQRKWKRADRMRLKRLRGWT